MTREQKIVEVKRLRAEGLSNREIAERVGANESTVRNWYLGGECRCGAPLDGSRGTRSSVRLCASCLRTRNAERNERLVEMWEEGVPTWEIAQRLGITAGRVRNWVSDARRRGQTISPRSAHDHDHWEEIEKLWLEGLTYRAIGERTGLSAQAVGSRVQSMRRAGLDLPYRESLASEAT